TAKVTVSDNEGNNASDQDSATVTVKDVVGSITEKKTAVTPTVNEPGGTATFQVDVTNNSAFDTVTINSLTDDVYGNLAAGCKDASNNSLVGQTIQPGKTLTCTFTGQVTGNAGTT